MQTLNRMKSTKDRIVWTRENILSLLAFLGIIILLLLMMAEGLKVFLSYPAGTVDQDVMPSVLGFYLFILWIPQIPLYLGFSAEKPSFKPLLILFVFIICSLLVSIILFGYCNQIRLVTENAQSFHFLSVRELYLFFLQMGNAIWYLDFPWGMFVFPALAMLSYLPFCLLWVKKKKVNHAMLFVFLSCVIFLLLALLFSFLLQAIVVAQEGVHLPFDSAGLGPASFGSAGFGPAKNTAFSTFLTTHFA